MIATDQWLTENNQGLIPLDRWQNTVDLMARLFEAPAAFIVQHTPQGFRTTVASNQKENPYGSGVLIAPDTNIFCRKIVLTQQLLYVNHATQDKEWETNPEVIEDGFNSYLGFPILWPDGAPFGTICVMDFKVTNYNDTYIKLVEQFRDLVQSDLLLVSQFDQIREMALNDELTGLFNRRGFLTVAQQRLKLAIRNHTDLCLIYLDMDGLKELNDNLGHEVGDQALKALSHAIQHKVRRSDLSARIGGDEFIILADTHNEEAMLKLCETINRTFKNALPEEAPAETGISFGVVRIDNFEYPIEYWIRQADEKMYALKKERKYATQISHRANS